MHDLWQDIRYAFRSIAKHPGFSAVVIATLAIGIGLNTTVFVSANAVIFRPFPYEDPSRLAAVHLLDKRTGEGNGPFSYPDYYDVRAKATSFANLAAYRTNSFNLSVNGAEPERIEGGTVTASMFPTLGIVPQLGRNFREDEDRAGANPVVMLSDDLWRSRFAADRGVIGRTVMLNGASYTIIGVMPKGFGFPGAERVWTTLNENPAQNRGAHQYNVLARLKTGVSVEKARSELATIMRQLELQYPESNLNFSATTTDLRKDTVGDTMTVLYIMMGAVGFVLLIACANVANLMLSRAASRQREIGIRTALGAGRARIMRQLLTESVILALAGSGIGLLLAAWGNDLINRAIPSDRPFWMHFDMDWRVLVFTAAIAAGTGLLCGLAPALQLSRPDLSETLKEGGQGAGSSRKRGRVRNALVVAEVALSLVLLVGAGLMTRSFLALQGADPGFDRTHLLSVRMFLAGPAYDSTYQRVAIQRDLVQRIQALPGVQGVAVTNFVPLTRSQSITVIQPDGKTYERGAAPLVSVHNAYGDISRVLGVPVLRGRGLTARDVTDSTRSVLINQTMAQKVWPGEEAVGKQFEFMGDDAHTKFTVVGVLGDIRARRLTDPPENQLYVPYNDWPFLSLDLLVRTAGDPMTVAPAVNSVIRERDAQLPTFDVESMETIFARSFWEKRLYGVMFTAFGAIALLLASIGLYAVIAYGVAQRTREIGVRMALGAASGDVVRMVVRSGVQLTGIGLAIGTVAGLALTGVLKSTLYGVSPRDPAVFVGVALLLALVALLASALPARRAAGVDPISALRSE